MRKRISGRVSMIGSTIDYCEKNSGAWSGIAAFGGVLNKVKLKKKKVDELSQVAEVTTKGVTKDTRELRRRMTEGAVRCGQATVAYAYAIGNNQLAAEVNFTANKLNKMRKERAADRCQGIKKSAQANEAGIAAYGIAPGDISDLQAAIDEYRLKAQNPRLAIIKRSGAKRQINEVVREVIDKLLELQLDRMVDTLRFSNEFFWTGYQMVREIVDLGTVHTKVKGTVRDINDVPLEGVRFTVYETDTQKVVREVSSGPDGSFKINPMAVGNFDFKWEKDKYATKFESNVRVGAGKVVRRRVTLKAI
jgi:hypothetical protein